MNSFERIDNHAENPACNFSELLEPVTLYENQGGASAPPNGKRVPHVLSKYLGFGRLRGLNKQTSTSKHHWIPPEITSHPIWLYTIRFVSVPVRSKNSWPIGAFPSRMRSLGHGAKILDLIIRNSVRVVLFNHQGWLAENHILHGFIA